jgi:hypothetical protein
VGLKKGGKKKKVWGHFSKGKRWIERQTSNLKETRGKKKR